MTRATLCGVILFHQTWDLYLLRLITEGLGLGLLGKQRFVTATRYDENLIPSVIWKKKQKKKKNRFSERPYASTLMYKFYFKDFEDYSTLERATAITSYMIMSSGLQYWCIVSMLQLFFVRLKNDHTHHAHFQLRYVRKFVLFYLGNESVLIRLLGVGKIGRAHVWTPVTL